MTSHIQLIVGLGNPGSEYDKTRHNAGAWFVEALIRQHNITLRTETKFNGKCGRIQLHGHDCHLLIPLTYMNLSGKAIKAIANFYKIPPEAILVAHDELDLPPGIARIKLDGGHGGHNGLRDTVAQLSTKNFYRLRLGIGHPGNSHQVADYVLNRPSRHDHDLIDQAIVAAVDVLPLLLDGHLQKAMHQLHSHS